MAAASGQTAAIDPEGDLGLVPSGYASDDKPDSAAIAASPSLAAWHDLAHNHIDKAPLARREAIPPSGTEQPSQQRLLDLAPLGENLIAFWRLPTSVPLARRDEFVDDAIAHWETNSLVVHVLAS